MFSQCLGVFSKTKKIEVSAFTGDDQSVKTLPDGPTTNITYLANTLSGTQNYSVLQQGVSEYITYLVDSLSGSNNSALIAQGENQYITYQSSLLNGTQNFVVLDGNSAALRADNYFAAVTTAGGTYTSGDRSAFITAVTALDAVASWADVVAWYPMFGGTLASMAIDAKDPTNRSQDITWGGDNVASSDGVLINANAYVPSTVLVPSSTSQLSTAVSVSGLNKTAFAAPFYSSLGDDYAFAIYYGEAFYGRAFSSGGGDTLWPVDGSNGQTLPFTGSAVMSTQPASGQQHIRVVAPSGNYITSVPRPRTGLNNSQAVRLGDSGIGTGTPFIYKGFLAVKSANGLSLAQDQALQVLTTNLQLARPIIVGGVNTATVNPVALSTTNASYSPSGVGSSVVIPTSLGGTNANYGMGGANSSVVVPTSLASTDANYSVSGVNSTAVNPIEVV